MPARAPPSTPFASRELNGSVLLEELADLRNSQVAQKHLNDLVIAMRDFEGLRVAEAQQRIKHLAANRFATVPALASLLVRWSARLKVEPDVPLLISHFERLALTSAIVSSVRRAADSLKAAR